MAVSDIVLPITFRSDARGLKKAERQLSKFGRGVGKIAAGATAAVVFRRRYRRERGEGCGRRVRAATATTAALRPGPPLWLWLRP